MDRLHQILPLLPSGGGGWHFSLTPREEYQHVLRELPLLGKCHERVLGFKKGLGSHDR